MQNQQEILSIMLNRLLKLSKTTVLFTLALILSVTSLATLIAPTAMAYPGQLDQTFQTNLGSGFDNGIVSITAIQSDGKILAGGDFTSFNGNTQDHRLIRLNSDGSKDTTFNLGATGFDNNAVYITTLQPDGKVLVGGNFTSFNGQTVGRLVRLNTTLAQVSSVSSPNPNTTLTKGQTATITINYDEPITVDTTNGSPTLALNLTNCSGNNLNRLATYVSGSGTNSLTFTYPIQPGDITNQLDYLNQNSLTLNGSTIKDAVGNNIPNTLPTPGQTGSLSQANIKVEDPSCNNLATPTAPNTGTKNKQNLILTTLGLLTLISLATYTIYKTRVKTYRAK